MATFVIVLITVLLARSRRKRRQPDGEIVLITGCDSGIGFFMAKRFLELGFNVVAGCLDSSSDGFKQLEKLGAKCLSMDVTSDQSILAAKLEVEDYMKSLEKGKCNSNTNNETT